MALDAAIGIGEEATYGTAPTSTIGYEGKADSWKVAKEFIESVGFRRGQQTARADRRNIITMGGEGELEVDLLDVGAAALFRAAFDKHSFTDTGAVRTHVFETATSNAAPSFTAQMIRPTVDGVNVAYKHVGCVATEWELSAETENAVALTVSFDFQDVSHTTVPAQALAIDYPAVARVYDWSRTALTLTRAGAPVPVDAGKFSLTGDLGMKTDRRFLRANALKKKPVRAAMPTYEGELEGEFSGESLKLYEAFTAGEVIALRVDLSGLTPGTSLRIDCPAIQFTGESPEAAVDDVTTHTLPFRVLDPGDAPAIRLTYVEPKPTQALKAMGTPEAG
ncbi:phage tail tube protein [Streptomyces sp. NBC_00291]|uniref:phage tail tube protein n=1 Tax=Streptomyces sp. NBC_00291 TaxID=2975704 RepID=UPI0022557371|nr:phage tail tube protein [Streptomyces sp. NBC_00291]MCX5153698.1 phage tail tube protein [Streptomyces sp. NBC_00291]